MARQSHHVFLFFLAHFFVRSLAQTQRNITVDDNSPEISYIGNWGPSAPSDLDAGGSHRLSEDPNANARIRFTGVAVYFMSPRWPYDVFTQIQLDDQPPVQLNLSDPNFRSPTADGPETVRSAVVWSSGTLQNTSHTLFVSKIQQPDRPYVIVDTIIYTMLDTPSSSYPSSTSTSSASATGSSSHDSSSSGHVLPIALGAGLGALGLLAVAVALWFFCGRRKRPNSEAWTTGGASEKSTFPSSGPLSPNPPADQSMYNVQHHQSYASSLNPNASWTGSTPQMSTVGVPLMANAQPSPHVNYAQPSQQYNPWSGFIPPHEQHQQGHYPQHQQDFNPSPFYAPTTLSTITEMSTPGTLNSNRVPLGASSPASHPSPDLSYYTPPPQGSGSGARLPYASDLPPGALAYQSQHPYASSSNGQLRSQRSTDGGKTGTLPGKLSREKGSLVAVNRTDEESEESRPPAYTF